MEQIINKDSAGKTLVCFGDSLTEGYMVEQKYSVPSRLQEWVTIPVANHGVSGDTTFVAMHRLSAAIKEEPRLAIVELGVNDRGWDHTVDQVRDNLSKMIKSFQECGAAVVLAGFSFGNTDEWETMYHSLAESHGALLVPNIYEGIFGNRDLLFMDGLHPNEDGYAAMAENYYKSMKPLLKYMKIDKREV